MLSWTRRWVVMPGEGQAVLCHVLFCPALQPPTCPPAHLLTSRMSNAVPARIPVATVQNPHNQVMPLHFLPFR